MRVGRDSYIVIDGSERSWLNTNMMESRQILLTSDLDGFDKVGQPTEPSGISFLAFLCFQDGVNESISSGCFCMSVPVVDIGDLFSSFLIRGPRPTLYFAEETALARFSGGGRHFRPRCPTADQVQRGAAAAAAAASRPEIAQHASFTTRQRAGEFSAASRIEHRLRRNKWQRRRQGQHFQ